LVPVFDIEVIDWTCPIAVGFYDGRTYREFLKLSDDYDVIWEFLEAIGKDQKKLRLFAHNAAHFDNKFILEALCRHGQKVKFVAGMAKIVWIEADISFEDSYILVGRGLASLCEAFDTPRKLTWDHTKTKDMWEGGDSTGLTEFRKYLERDCISLSLALDKYCQVLLENFGVTPSSTLSLTAVKAFDKSFYPVKQIEANEGFEDFIRAATYGGRNEVYKRYGEDLNIYDVRSMYVSCYDVPVPIGKLYWTKPNLDVGTLARAIVKVPDDKLIGPLPYRHQGRLIFPVGEFEGLWDTRELRYAANQGTDVTLVSQLRCDEEPILKDFGLRIQDLRKTDNLELSKIWKLFGLRLSGKFGQHRYRSEVKHISEIEDQEGYYPIDDGEIYHERTILMKGHRSPYIKPAINMRVRSEARLRHLSLLQDSDPYYCDTDSIYTTSKLPTGPEIGDLRLVGRAARAYFVRCKFYGYLTYRGILNQRTSGYRDFKLSEYDFRKLLEGREIISDFQSLGNWKDILQGKGIVLSDRHRAVSRFTQFENRVTSGSETYPIKLPLQRNKKTIS